MQILSIIQTFDMVYLPLYSYFVGISHNKILAHD